MAQDGLVTIRIEDHGPGIDPRDGDRIFERFYRGRAERAGEGTGLGLAIARAGAERAGGTLRVERSGADGTMMTFELPAAQRASPTTEELPDGDDPARRG
jgi:two-component system sensor histidine kinase MprB